MKETLQHTIKISLLFSLSIMNGYVEASYGPSVKDYQCIFRETRHRTSLLYPIYTTFKAIGTLVCFLLRNHVDNYLVSVVCMEIITVLLVILPLMSYIWIAVLLSSVIGLANGIGSHARLVESGKLAKDSAVPIHMFPLGMCTGSFIGPLVMSPFLGDAQNNTYHGDKTLNNTTNSTAADECNNFHSNIVFGFLIFVSVGTIVFIAYTLHRQMFHSENDKESKSEGEATSKIERLDVLFLIFVAMIIAIGGPTNFIYGYLLSTFGIYSSLGVPSQLMAIMTSSFFATTLIGRIFGTWISLVLNQLALITVCMIGSVSAAIALVFLSQVSVVSLWVVSCVLGLLYSPLFGAMIALSSKVSRTKHIIYGLIVIADLSGAALMTFLMGQLMNKVDINYLNYIMLGTCVMQIVIFVALYVIASFQGSTYMRID